MNEEELKAIENLKHIIKHWKPDNEEDELANIEYNSIKIAVNLIENSVSKDAIKEQIKWLEHDIEKTKQNITKGNNFMTYINDYRKIRMKAFVTKSKEIKSRLEKLLGD